MDDGAGIDNVSGKRFNKVKVYLSYEIFDNKGNEQLDVNKIVDLMNQLNDENEQLKKELKALRKKYNDFSDMVDKRLKELKMND